MMRQSEDVCKEEENTVRKLEGKSLQVEGVQMHWSEDCRAKTCRRV